LILAVVWGIAPNSLCAATITFEELGNGDLVTDQYAVATFTNATVLTAGISLNEFEFPPQSGSNVIFDTGGPISIDFSMPVTRFQTYLTYLVPIAVRGFDAGNNLVISATTLFGTNLALSGELGSAPNELVSVEWAGGIARVWITGDLAGGSFTLDDATVTGVPEPSSALLVFTSYLAFALLHRNARQGRAHERNRERKVR
jgi:hypothetical protein